MTALVVILISCTVALAISTALLAIALDQLNLCHRMMKATINRLARERDDARRSLRAHGL